MNNRERIKSFIDFERTDNIPVCCRLDLWLKAREAYNDIPDEIKGLDLEEVQLKLGMAVSARKAIVFEQLYSKPVEYQKFEEKGFLREIWKTPIGSLKRSHKFLNNGLVLAIDEYPIKNVDDFKVFEYLMEHVEYKPTYSAYSNYDKEIGQNGLPMVILGAWMTD